MMAEESDFIAWQDCFLDNIDWFSDLNYVGVAVNQEDELSGAGRSLQYQPRFAAPLPEEQVAEARKGAIPKKTQLDTKY